MPGSMSPRSPRSPSSPMSPTNIRTIAGPDTNGLYVDGTRDGELGWADPDIDPEAFPVWPDPPLVDTNAGEASVFARMRMATATTTATTATAIAASTDDKSNNIWPNTPRPTKLSWAIPDKAADLLERRRQRNRDKAAAHYQGITLNSIVQGRTCRPISLNDLSTYLRAQRLSPSSVSLTPAALPDLTTTKTSTSSSAGKSTANTSLDEGFGIQLFPATAGDSPTSTGDALDALNFVVACDRYRRRWRALSPARRAKSVLNVSGSQADLSRVDSNGTNQSSGSGADNSAEMTLRTELDRLLSRFVGIPESSAPLSTPDSIQTAPRLRWMVDSGLLPETLFASVLEHAAMTTNPDVLANLDAAVSQHLSQHYLPDFLLLSTRNLGTGARFGRLLVAIVCFAIAVTFTVLLDMRPTPLSHSSPRQDLPRYWRLLTLPFYMAAIGYAIAFNTGVCVWLSLRGNIDMDDVRPDEDANDGAATRESARGSRPSLLRRSLPSRPTRCGDGTDGSCAMCPVGGDAHDDDDHAHTEKCLQGQEEPLDADAQAAKSYRDQVECRARSYYIAPELYDLLKRFLPRVALRLLEKPLPKSSAGERHPGLESEQMKEVFTSRGLAAGSTQDARLTPVPESASSDAIVEENDSGSASRSPRRRPLNIDVETANASAHSAPDVPSPTASVVPVINTPRATLPSPSQRSVRLPGLPISLVIVRPPTYDGATITAPLPASPKRAVAPVLSRSEVTAPTASAKTDSVAVPDWGNPTIAHIPTLSQQFGGPATATAARRGPASTRSSIKAKSSSKSSAASRAYASLKRWTGFAPTTTRVLDQAVRRAHQIEALKALAWCTGLTALVAIVVLAVP